VANRAPVVARFSPMLYALLPLTCTNNSHASPKQPLQQQPPPQQQQQQERVAAGEREEEHLSGSPSPQQQKEEQQSPTVSGSPNGRPHLQGGQHDAGHEGPGTPPASPFMLPYRMVLAVATLNSVLVYDTQVRSCV